MTWENMFYSGEWNEKSQPHCEVSWTKARRWPRVSVDFCEGQRRAFRRKTEPQVAKWSVGWRELDPGIMFINPKLKKGHVENFDFLKIFMFFFTSFALPPHPWEILPNTKEMLSFTKETRPALQEIATFEKITKYLRYQNFQHDLFFVSAWKTTSRTPFPAIPTHQTRHGMTVFASVVLHRSQHLLQHRQNFNRCSVGNQGSSIPCPIKDPSGGLFHEFKSGEFR